MIPTFHKRSLPFFALTLLSLLVGLLSSCQADKSAPAPTATASPTMIVSASTPAPTASPPLGLDPAVMETFPQVGATRRYQTHIEDLGGKVHIRDQTITEPTVTPTAPNLAPGTDAVIDCADIYPGLPGCLRDEPLVGGRLAFVTERLPFGRTTILDLEHEDAWTLSPVTLLEWSPSGSYLLAGRSIVYRYDGVAMSSLSNRPTAFWAPLDALPGARDWLAMPTADGALLAVPLPEGEPRQVLPPGSLGNDGRGIVLWSPDGWLAWSLNTDQLTEAGQFEQTLYIQPAEGDAEVTAWRLSDDIREAYYQIVDWVPGTRLILAARGMLAVSLWSWGAPLVTINTDTGEITDLGVAMLLTPEAYAWHPTQPGLLALAEGGSRYLFETGHLALLDVTTGELRALTGPDIAAFEPVWSPDGTLLAYAAVPASPDASGDGTTLEHTLDGRAIYIVNPQSGETRTLTDPGDAVDGWPQWSANGTCLLYTRQHDGYTDVRVVTLDGSSDELLVTGLTDPTCYYGGCGWQQMLAYHPGSYPVSTSWKTCSNPVFDVTLPD